MAFLFGSKFLFAFLLAAFGFLSSSSITSQVYGYRNTARHSVQQDSFPLNGQHTVNTQGPDPQVRFETDFPSHVIVSPDKSKPQLLPCHATVEVDHEFLNQLYSTGTDNARGYTLDEAEYEDLEEDEDTLEDDLENDNANIAPSDSHHDVMSTSHKQARTHFTDLISDTDHTKAHHETPNSEKHGASEEEADLYDEDEEDEDTDDGNSLLDDLPLRSRRSRRAEALNKFNSDGGERPALRHPKRFASQQSHQLPLFHIDYTWYRNGEVLLTTSTGNTSRNGFRLAPNGTLRIQYSNQTSGVYRCLANETKFGIGATLSNNVAVSVAMLARDSAVNGNQTVTAITGESVVLNCPIKSFPTAHFSWYINKTAIISSVKDASVNGIGNINNRYLLLCNGSLLITSLVDSDTGRYKCDATNEMMTKGQRNVFVTLEVRQPSAGSRNKLGLLPPLQNTTINVRAGDMLRLLCASYTEKIKWSFTPRNAQIPIILSGFNQELKYVNVSVHKHDGVYNCSTATDHQLYYVTVMTPPVFTHDFKSRTTSVATPAVFNCSAIGNPPPVITWYRNGQQLENSYLINYDPPTLRISSVEPEDQGIYECFARNSAGEAKISGHLTVRKKQQYKGLDVRPFNVRCYPAGDKNLIVRFDSKWLYTGITYYIASKQPYEWQTPPLEMVFKNNSINISSHVVPFRRHGIFLRGLMVHEKMQDGQQMLLSRLSDPVECATQSVTIHYTVSPTSSIFIWWNTDESNMTGYVIQFWHNDTENPIPFTDNIVGTVEKFPNYDNYLTWSEIDPFLQKLPAVARFANFESFARKRREAELDFYDDDDDEEIIDYGKSRLFARHAVYPTGVAKITEVKVAGNVTGILIPNTQKVVVRVLGSMEPDGEPMDQDLRYVPWQRVELNSVMPKTRLQVDPETRLIRVNWSSIEAMDTQEPACLEVCYKNVIHDFIQRGGKTIECRKILNPMESAATVDKLSPLAHYKIYLRQCNQTQPLSDIVDVSTKQDIPSPITQVIILKQDDGVVAEWKPPAYPNGLILYYLIQWTKDDQQFAANVSDSQLSFKFPNTSATDSFSMSIRAVNTAGISAPYLREISPFDLYMTPDHQILGILIGVFLSLLVVLACIWIFLRKRRCSKSHYDHNASSGPMSTAGQNMGNCTAELHEMQTLITRPDATSISTIVPNGNASHLSHSFSQRPDVTNVNETRTLSLSHMNDKMLALAKTSPSLSLSRQEIEPLTNGTDRELTTFHASKVGNGHITRAAKSPQSQKRNGYVRPSMPVAIIDAFTSEYSVHPIGTTSGSRGQLHIPEPRKQTSTSSIDSSSNSISSSSDSTVVMQGALNSRTTTNIRATDNTASASHPRKTQYSANPEQTPSPTVAALAAADSSLFDNSRAQLIQNTSIDSCNEEDNLFLINNPAAIVSSTSPVAKHTRSSNKCKNNNKNNTINSISSKRNNQQIEPDLNYDITDSDYSLQARSAAAASEVAGKINRSQATSPATINGSDRPDENDAPVSSLNNNKNWMESYRRPLVGPNG